MFQEFYSSLGVLKDPVVAGSWASILALMGSLYGLVWVRRTRLLMKKDREKHSMTLPEVHHALQRAEKYVRRQPEDLERISVLKDIHRAEYALERHLEKVFKENPGKNAFLRVANFYRNLGEVNLAIAHYKRAIDCLERDRRQLVGGGHHLAAEPQHLSEETIECFYELQACHLAVWQVKAAARVARQARSQGSREGYISEAEIAKPWIYLRCAEHTLVFLTRDFAAKITRKKGKL